MKLSELMKKYTDVIVKMYDDCDLEELTEEQKEYLMILIHRASLMTVTELSEDVYNGTVEDFREFNRFISS